MVVFLSVARLRPPSSAAVMILGCLARLQQLPVRCLAGSRRGLRPDEVTEALKAAVMADKDDRGARQRGPQWGEREASYRLALAAMLQAQRQRLQAYADQARYAVAELYDRATRPATLAPEPDRGQP